MTPVAPARKIRFPGDVMAPTLRTSGLASPGHLPEILLGHFRPSLAKHHIGLGDLRLVDHTQE